MRFMKCLFVGIVCVIGFFGGAFATDLTGTASVNITSDTAAAAKDIAFDEARRQIISEVLGQYANPEQLDGIIKISDAAALTGLVAASSVDGEQQSDTTYSANITMTIDRNAARQWMNDNYVQNWLTDGVSGDVFVTQIIMTDKMARWIELRDIARREGINMTTKFINGNQITVEIPTSQRAKFTIAVRENGWRYENQNGVLVISK